MISSVGPYHLYQAAYSSHIILLDERFSKEVFSDTNDYESAPNLEASKEEPFGKLLLLGFGPSVR